MTQVKCKWCKSWKFLLEIVYHSVGAGDCRRHSLISFTTETRSSQSRDNEWKMLWPMPATVRRHIWNISPTRTAQVRRGFKLFSFRITTLFRPFGYGSFLKYSVTYGDPNEADLCLEIVKQKYHFQVTSFVTPVFASVFVVGFVIIISILHTSHQGRKSMSTDRIYGQIKL